MQLLQLAHHRLAVVLDLRLRTRCQVLHLAFQGLQLFLQVLHLGIQRLVGLRRHLGRHLTRNRLHRFVEFLEALIDLARQTTHRLHLLGQFKQGLGRLSEGTHRRIQLHHTFAHSQGQRIELADVLLHAGGNGKENTDRDQNEQQHGPENDLGVLHAALVRLRDLVHHRLHVAAHVRGHRSGPGGDLGRVQHHTGQVLELARELPGIQSTVLEFENFRGRFFADHPRRGIGRTGASLGMLIGRGVLFSHLNSLVLLFDLV